ncbi:uncharacterized protein [Dermacentor andersoni]|uniref:uncharacterized protein n=1 Tax=Dermacentor andersoni TaxID=34620 RepID=UPI003B3BA3C2
MPGSCCAPNCRSNYGGGPSGASVRVYKFPADETRRAAWTKAICRENFVPRKHTVVCEKHFEKSDFVTVASYTDLKTGKVIEVPLERARLKPTAVHSLFPGCPKYMSQPKRTREAPAEKKARLEAASVRKAIELSAAIFVLVFSGKLYTISPHAYKFIRSSLKVKLPHPDAIRRLCSSYHLNPALEQQDFCFLNYAKTVLQAMAEHERTVTLMIDEIHLQTYCEYKAGFVTGSAANTSNPTKTAYVFMLQSLLSSNKDVVYILPVAQIDAKAFQYFLLKITIDLESLGFKVLAVVSDNNAINVKTMTFFASPPKASIGYPHPADSSRPLFFILDHVHLLDYISNNWLNQRNSGKCMLYPDPSSNDPKPPILPASFKSLSDLHNAEQNNILKLVPTLSLKALNPSSIERQNFKLALRIFNESTVAALQCSIVQHAKGKADFINTILTWWRIANVKTPRKGQRLRDEMQYPIVSTTRPQLEFLRKITEWLDYWASLKPDAGHLTKETQLAFGHTSHALHDICVYCLEELGFQYVLLGKFQTDGLEDRFGKYRQLSGAQYHISNMQIYESENKLRLQKVLDLPDLDVIAQPIHTISVDSLRGQFTIAVTKADVAKKSSMIPTVTYVAGYCAHVTMKKLMCLSCKVNLILENTSLDHEDTLLIAGMTRGGLKFPCAVVVNAVLCTEIALDKFRSEELASKFLALPNQKEALVALVSTVLHDSGGLDDLRACNSGHSPEKVMHHILSAAANTLLNNLSKTKNDKTILNSSSNGKAQKTRTQAECFFFFLTPTLFFRPLSFITSVHFIVCHVVLFSRGHMFY